MIYLDHAAATPLDPKVYSAMEPYMKDIFYNPSALYDSARSLRRDIDDFRKQVASIIGAKPSEVYFTAGATESINMAIAGVMRMHPDSSMVTSKIEHSAVQSSAHAYAKEVRFIPPSPTGEIDPQAVAASIDDTTSLVSLGYANSEIGTIQPIKEIARLLQEIRNQRSARGVAMPLYFHTDASAAAECLNIDVGALGVDMLTLNGAKMYGPKQSGVLFVRHDAEIAPLIYGGSQERGLRSGSENPAAIAGFTKALEIAQAHHKDVAHHLKKLSQQLIFHLEKIDGAQLNGSKKHRIPSNVNFSFPGLNGEMLVHHLDARGVLVSTGAACDASQNKPSEVLQAIGCSEEEMRGSLRLSLGRNNSEGDIADAAKTIEQLTIKLRQR